MARSTETNDETVCNESRRRPTLKDHGQSGVDYPANLFSIAYSTQRDYLIQIIQQTQTNTGLVNIINQHCLPIPWDDIPTGNRNNRYWKDELSRLGVQDRAPARIPSQQPPRNQPYQLPQNPNTPRYQPIAPRPDISAPSASPPGPAAQSVAGSSGGKKRGRPTKAESEKKTAEQGSSTQQLRAPSRKRARHEPGPPTRSPPKAPQTPSAMSTTTTTTSPTTLASSGPESASFYSTSRHTEPIGLGVSSTRLPPRQPQSRPQRPSTEPQSASSAEPSSANPFGTSHLTLPRPNTSDIRSSRDPFPLPGIPSTTQSSYNGGFFGSTQPSSYSQSRAPSYLEPRPSYPQPFSSSTRYEGPPARRPPSSTQRQDDRRRQSDDPMEH